jgi:hypothetical protein
MFDIPSSLYHPSCSTPLLPHALAQALRSSAPLQPAPMFLLARASGLIFDVIIIGTIINICINIRIIVSVSVSIIINISISISRVDRYCSMARSLVLSLRAAAF